MPFAGFENFNACLVHMKEKEGYSEEVAKKVCGKLQAEAEMESITDLDKSLIVELQCRDSDLPASSYAWVEDPDKKTTWHLPYKDANGKVKCNCVRSALAAIGGARTGKSMNVPQSAIDKLKSAAKGCGIETEHSSIQIKDKEKVVELLIAQKNIQFTDEPNGDTVFHDVTLMAEGTWIDSYSKMPNFYSAEEVAAMKIEKATLKMDHDIFNQQPIINEIGIVENLKLISNPARWKGDVRIYPTQNGKDIALLLKRGQFKGISPEMFRTPIYDKENQRIIAKDLSFMGAATVREGACSLCTFNEGVENLTEETPPNTGGIAPGGATVELNSEQKARIAMLEQELKDKQSKTSAEFIAAHESLEKENKILKEQVAMLQKQIGETEYAMRVADLERQVKAISAQPVIHTKITTGTGRNAVELDSDPDYPIVSVRDLE